MNELPTRRQSLGALITKRRAIVFWRAGWTLPKRAISHGCWGNEGTDAAHPSKFTPALNKCLYPAFSRLCRPTPSETSVSRKITFQITAVPSSSG